MKTSEFKKNFDSSMQKQVDKYLSQKMTIPSDVYVNTIRFGKDSISVGLKFFKGRFICKLSHMYVTRLIQLTFEDMKK